MSNWKGKNSSMLMHPVITSLAIGCLQALITMNAMMFRGAGISALGWVYDNYLSFCLASILTSFLVAGYVYYASFKPDKMLALGGNTGNAVYDVSMLLF
jgi:Ergosterol biosynthesis ERG4/ERG24 family